MRRILYGLLVTTVTLITSSLLWRWASRRYRLPCPSWLAGFLESPLADLMGGTETTLRHIGLRVGERGLDVGSGPGRLTLPAARQVGPRGEIVALDIQPEMLARLERRIGQTRLDNISTRLGDISTDAGLPANHFDRAWLVTVLGEIPDREAALDNLYRVLKPGGTLSITEVLGDPHYQRHRTVLQLAQAAGFKPAAYWRTGLAYTQNFKKQ